MALDNARLALGAFVAHPTDKTMRSFVDAWALLPCTSRESLLRELHGFMKQHDSSPDRTRLYQTLIQRTTLLDAIECFLETPTVRTADALALHLSGSGEVGATMIENIHRQYNGPPELLTRLSRYLQRPAATRIPLQYPVAEAETQYMQELTTSQTLIQHIQEVLQRDIMSTKKNESMRQWVKTHEEGQRMYQQFYAMLEENPQPAHRHLHDMLTREPRLKAIYTVAEFLRSYIDFHHDFTSNDTKKLIIPTRKAFEKNILPDLRNQALHRPTKTLGAWYTAWINQIDLAIITRKGNVNEINCRVQMQKLVDDVIGLISDEQNVGSDGVVNWIPLTSAMQGTEYVIRKMNAPDEAITEEDDVMVVGDESVYEKTEIIRLQSELKSMGVNQCFFESCGNRVYRVLTKSGSDLKNTVMPIASWDGMIKDRRTGSVELLNTRVSDLTLFGGVLQVEADTVSLHATWHGDKVEEITITPQARLSLNSLLDANGIAPLRPMRGDKPVQPIVGMTPHNASFVPLLKTWTDYMQVRVLLETQRLETRSPSLTAMVTGDHLCIFTAQLYGLPFAIYGDKNKMTLYMFDQTASTVHSRQEKERRAETLAAVLYDRDQWKTYLHGWFHSVHSWLTSLLPSLYDPAVYMGIKQFMVTLQHSRDRAGEYWKELDIQWKEHNKPQAPRARRNTLRTSVSPLFSMLQSFPTSLTEWFHQRTDVTQLVEDMQNAYDGVRNYMNAIQAAPNPTTWRTAYQALKQVLVNAGMEEQSSMAGMLAIMSLETPRDNVEERLGGMRNMAESVLTAFVQWMSIPNGAKKPITSAIDPLPHFMNVVLPSYPTREEWELCLSLLRRAKQEVVELGMTDQKMEHVVAQNVMEVYHVLLQNTELAELIEVLLLAGCIVLRADANSSPFRFKMDSEENAANDTHQYKFTSWRDQFVRSKDKSYTLSMIDQKNSMEMFMYRAAKLAEEPAGDIHGLIKRVQGAHVHSLCELDKRYLESFNSHKIQACRASSDWLAIWKEIAMTTSIDQALHGSQPIRRIAFTPSTTSRANRAKTRELTKTPIVSTSRRTPHQITHDRTHHANTPMPSRKELDSHFMEVDPTPTLSPTTISRLSNAAISMMQSSGPQLNSLFSPRAKHTRKRSLSPINMNNSPASTQSSNIIQPVPKRPRMNPPVQGGRRTRRRRVLRDRFGK